MTMHQRNTILKLLALGLTALLSACGGGGGLAIPGPGSQPAPPRGEIDPARGDLLYSHVLRSASGLPQGVRLTWTSQPEFSYRVYKSDNPIPNSARGGAPSAPVVSDNSGIYIDTFTDGTGPVQIGQTWFYRISAIDSDGDESRLSPELQVDITAHFITQVNPAAAAPGEQLTIAGGNFGAAALFDPAVDKVFVRGATWTGLAPGGFDLTAPLAAQIDSWGPDEITITLPAGFISGGPLTVEIAGGGANSPLPVSNTSPFITSIAPLEGTAADSIVLQGGGFGTSAATSSVQFAAAAGAAITAIADGEITFTPPVRHDFILHPLHVERDTLSSNTAFFQLRNKPPVAAAAVARSVGHGFLRADFDLSGSTDFEDDFSGLALSFDYDFDNDGTYDLLGAGPQVSHTYTSLGNHECMVRVVDSGGASTELDAAVTIQVLPSRAGPWSMSGNGSGGGGSASVAGPQSSAYKRRAYPTSGNILARPVYDADGTAFIADSDGRIYGMLADGNESFRTASYGNPFEQSALVARDGTVYAADSSGLIIALTGSGVEKWTASGPPNPTALIQGPDEAVFVGGDDGTLLAFRDDGSVLVEQWRATLPDEIRAAPAVGEDGALYVCCADGKLYSFSEAGAPRWVFDTPSGMALNSSPALSPLDGTVIFAGEDGFVYAVTDNANSAALKWSTDLAAGSIDVSPALYVDPGNDLYVYTGTRSGAFIGLRDDGAAGTPAAQLTGVGGLLGFNSAAVGSDGKVYVSNLNGLIYCLAPDLTTVHWSFDTGAPLLGSPSLGLDPNHFDPGAPAPQPLYVGTNGSGLLAFGIPNPRPPVITGFSMDNGATSKETAQDMNVNFHITAESPDNVEITEFHYDFDGDLTTDLVSGSSSESYAYPAGGNYFANAIVKDENDLLSELSPDLGPVKVWSVDSGFPFSAKHVRVADAQGLPMLVYIEEAAPAGNLWFQRMVDSPSGPVWDTPALLASDAALVTSREILDIAVNTSGNIAVLYQVGLSLKIRTAVNYGAAWNAEATIYPILPLTGCQDAAVDFVDTSAAAAPPPHSPSRVSSGGPPATRSASGISNGDTPAVVFAVNVGIITGALFYAVADNTAGTAWPILPVPQLLASGADSCDLAIIGGRPAVAATGPGLLGIPAIRYWRASTADGAGLTDWPLLPVEVNIGNNLEECALAEVQSAGGTPLAAVAVLRQSTQKELHYIVSSSLDWAVTPVSTLLHSGLLNRGVGLASVGLRPCAAWGAGTGLNQFSYFRANNSDGSSWTSGGWLPLLSGTADTGYSVSITELVSGGGNTRTAAVAFTTNSMELVVCREPLP